MSMSGCQMYEKVRRCIPGLEGCFAATAASSVARCSSVNREELLQREAILAKATAGWCPQVCRSSSELATLARSLYEGQGEPERTGQSCYFDCRVRSCSLQRCRTRLCRSSW